jgi:hypothetical protein
VESSGLGWRTLPAVPERLDRIVGGMLPLYEAGATSPMCQAANSAATLDSGAAERLEIDALASSTV